MHIFGDAKQKIKNDEKTETKQLTWYDYIEQICPVTENITTNNDITITSSPTITNAPEWLYQTILTNDNNKKTNDLQKNDAITMGIAIHRAMQYLISSPSTENWLQIMHQYPDNIINTAVKRARECYDSPDFQKLLKNHTRIETEVELLHDGRLLRLDAIIFYHNKIIIIDFKTGNPTGDHSKQLQQYITAVKSIYQNYEVNATIVVIF